MFVFLSSNDVAEYRHTPPPEVWFFACFYMVYGIMVLGFLYHYRNILQVVLSND